MNIKRVILCVIFFSGLGVISLYSQETILTAGGNVSNDEGSVSYSIGQLIYTTTTATSGSVSQGVQQPYEISMVTEIEDIKINKLRLTVYPNPTSDLLTIKIASSDLQTQLMTLLYNSEGKLLNSKKIESIETNIVMSNLIPATYFLKIVTLNEGNSKGITDCVSIFKIIKIN